MQVSNLHVIVHRYKFHQSEMYQTDKERVSVCVGCVCMWKEHGQGNVCMEKGTNIPQGQVYGS